MNPPFFSAELLQKILLDILYQVKAHYKCMYIISWELYIKHCENMSKRYSEAPNWARTLLNLEKFKGNVPGRTIPLILEAAVEELAMVSIQDFQEVRGARQKREREIERTR